MESTSRPRLLLLSFYSPSATGKGSRIRAWAWLETLSRHYSIYLLILGEPPQCDLSSHTEFVAHIPPEWSSIRAESDSGMGRLRFLSSVLAGPLPGYWDLKAEEIARIARVLPVREFDAVFAIRLSMAYVGQQLLDSGQLTGKAIGFDLDDRESMFARRNARLTGLSHGKLMALEAFLRGPRLERLERRMARRWGQVFVCSKQDADELNESQRDVRFTSIPNTLRDPGLLPPLEPMPGTARLLFVGSLAYVANEDGLEWFVKEVWPELGRQFGQLKWMLNVVGAKPTKRVIEMTAGEESRWLRTCPRCSLITMLQTSSWCLCEWALEPG